MRRLTFDKPDFAQLVSDATRLFLSIHYTLHATSRVKNLMTGDKSVVIRVRRLVIGRWLMIVERSMVLGGQPW